MTTFAEEDVRVSAIGAEPAAKRVSTLDARRFPWAFATATVHAICAALLLASAGLKASQMINDPLAGTTFPLIRATIAEMWWWELGVVVGLLMLGLTMIVLIGSWKASLLAGGVYSVFIGVSLLHIIAGEGSRSCGCFGSYELNAYFSASLSLAVVGAIVLLPPSMATRQVAPRRRAKSVGFLVGGSTAGLVIAAGAALALNIYHPKPLRAEGPPGQAHAVLVRPNEWVGRRCPLLPHVTTNARLDQGRWVVIVSPSACQSCQAVLREYQKFAYQMSTPKHRLRLAAIEPNQAKSRQHSGVSHPHLPSPVVGHLDASRRWHANVPVVLLLYDGIVEMAIEGAVRGSSKTMREFAPVSPIASARSVPRTPPQTLEPSEPKAFPPRRAEDWYCKECVRGITQSSGVKSDDTCVNCTT